MSLFSKIRDSKLNHYYYYLIILNYFGIYWNCSKKVFLMTFQKSKILHIFIIHLNFVTVQSLGHVQLFVTLWTRARQASLFFTSSWSMLKLMSIESVTPSNLILCCPLLLLPSIFPSIRVFSNESALHIRKWNYWSFNFNISPSSEYSGLISFRIDRFDLLAIQEILESLLQHHNSKASIIWHSAFWSNSHMHIWLLEKS